MRLHRNLRGSITVGHHKQRLRLAPDLNLRFRILASNCCSLFKDDMKQQYVLKR